MVNPFRKTYKFEIIGISPERFINIANRRRLHVFNIHCAGNRVFGFIAASKFYTLSDAANKAGVQLEIVQSYGLPCLVKNYKKRFGFVLGFAVFCFILWYLSLFVWFVDTVNLPEQYTVSASDALYDVGIRQGVLCSSIDGSQVEMELEKELPQFDFIKVSRLGCNAEIYFAPSQMPKKSVAENEPCDIVSTGGGEIATIIADVGTPLVQPGDIVYPGDVLISGLFEGKTGNIEMVHSHGRVEAIIEHTLSTSIDYRQTIKEPTGRIITINRLMAFSVEIPLFGSAPKGNYSRTYEEFHAKFLGFELPFTLRREYWSELCYTQNNLSYEECLAQAEKILDGEMKNIGALEVIAHDTSVSETNGGIRVTRHVTTLEDITEERDILFD